MTKGAQLTFSKRSSKKNTKLYLSFLLIIIMVGSLVFYEYFNYKILVRDFSSSFDKNEFANANNLLLSKENFNPFKSIYLKDDLTKYFSSKVTDISSDLKNGTINEVSAFDIIEEIKRYDVPINIPEELVLGTSYESAITLFNSGNIYRLISFSLM